MRKLIQIKGANGTGKTTIIKQLLALSKDVQLLQNPDVNKGKPYATILADLGWVIVGYYPAEAKGGGCDLIRTMEEMKDIVQALAAGYPEHWIVFEGAMISTTRTMYDYIATYIDPNPLLVILLSDMDGCIRRLEERKGMKLTPEYFTQLEDKVKRMQKQAGKYPSEHMVYIDVNNIPKEEMLWEFLAAVGWNPESQP